MTREQKLEEALRDVRTWANSQCPCHEETPNPCTLCGASVESLDACKAVESIFPRNLLRKLDAALSTPKVEAVAWAATDKKGNLTALEFRRADAQFSDDGGAVPLYTYPIPTITDEAVERAAKAIAEAWGETWECSCTKRRGLDCGCGDTIREDRERRLYDEDLTREDCRTAARAALLSAFPSRGETE